jgi:hypothetical protein
MSKYFNIPAETLLLYPKKETRESFKATCKFLVRLLGDKPLQLNDPHENHRDTPW